MTSARAGRQVYCVVTDKYGNKATSSTVTLHLVTSVQIIKQPGTLSAPMGEPCEISLTAVGKGLTYQWYYKDEGAARFTKTSTFTGNRYYIIMTEARAGRQVYCVVTDAYGNSVTSRTASLLTARSAANQAASVVSGAGDVNGDGLISMLDVIDYTAWLAGEEVCFIRVNADVNGDGAANAQDVNLLMDLCCETE